MNETRKLTSDDFHALDQAFNESFENLLRNIIAGYPDNPERIGQMLAQFLIHADVDRTINRGEYRCFIPFEIEMMCSALIRSIVCFRFLQDWNMLGNKTDEEMKTLRDKFQAMYETQEAKDWMTRLIKGGSEYCKEFRKKHSKIQCKYLPPEESKKENPS